MPAALLKANHNAVHVLCQELCGEPRHRVALMHQRGNMELGGGHQHRIADIAAGADHRVWLEFPDDPLCLMLGGKHVLHSVQIVGDRGKGPAACDIGNVQRPDLVARAGHELHLHLALGAEEQDLGVRHQLPQAAGHGQGGIHMSGGTAAGKNKSHIYVSPMFRECPGRR